MNVYIRNADNRKVIYFKDGDEIDTSAYVNTTFAHAGSGCVSENAIANSELVCTSSQLWEALDMYRKHKEGQV